MRKYILFGFVILLVLSLGCTSRFQAKGEKPLATFDIVDENGVFKGEYLDIYAEDIIIKNYKAKGLRMPFRSPYMHYTHTYSVMDVNLGDTFTLEYDNGVGHFLVDVVVTEGDGWTLKLNPENIVFIYNKKVELPKYLFLDKGRIRTRIYIDNNISLTEFKELKRRTSEYFSEMHSYELGEVRKEIEMLDSINVNQETVILTTEGFYLPQKKTVTFEGSWEECRGVLKSYIVEDIEILTTDYYKLEYEIIVYQKVGIWGYPSKAHIEESK